MANWLQKIMLPAATKKATALAKVKLGALATTGPATTEKLPNASVIYGIAASVLIIVAVYFLFTGRWFTAFLILLPAACFLGFALHFMSGNRSA